MTTDELERLDNLEDRVIKLEDRTHQLKKALEMMLERIECLSKSQGTIIEMQQMMVDKLYDLYSTPK